MRENYYNNNRLYNFETKVLSTYEDKDGFFQVELEGTYFYPEGGGQPSDKGTIDGLEVLDVQKINSKIYHKLKTKPTGNNVLCSIDKNNRDHYMVQHTGQHLISAVLKNELNIDTLSVHLGEQTTKIEIDRSKITKEELDKLEDVVYELICSGKKIKYHETDDEGLSNFNIRRASKYSGYIRVVEIEDYDSVPCGGVHLSNLYELGLIKITGYEKIRGHIRISFLIGRNALLDYRNKSDIITNINRDLSTTTQNVLEGINILKKNISNSKLEIKNLSNAYSKLLVDKIKTDKPTYLEFTETPISITQKIVGELTTNLSKPLLIINITEKLNWYLINSEDKSIDFNKFKIDLLPIINGKGGGRDTLWQGSGEINNLIEFVNRYKEYNKALT